MGVFDEQTGVLAVDPSLSIRSDSAVTACLVVIAGGDVGRIFRLSEAEATIGRGPSNTICIHDDGVSRLHASVRGAAPGVFLLRDEGSRNGTFCNGQRIEQQQLADGDKVMIGSTTVLKFSFSDPVEQSFQERLCDSALRDWLTGCFNKGYFERELKIDATTAQRGQPLSLLMLDLDHFKLINDTYGHTVGDAVLRHVATSVAAQLPAGATFARYGGEEFAVLLPDRGAEQATQIAERVRRSLEDNPATFEDERIAVTVSIGVATFRPGQDHSGEDLVVRADICLYAAKSAGRNRVHG